MLSNVIGMLATSLVVLGMLYNVFFCFYNHSQQLEGRVDGTNTCPGNSIQEERNYYKKGVKGDRKGGWNPYHTRGSRKSSSNRAEDQSSLVNSVHLNLIMENTVLTIVHTLKPSSLTHSLQIHCTGLIGRRSHASWTWPEKGDPTTIILYITIISYLKF